GQPFPFCVQLFILGFEGEQRHFIFISLSKPMQVIGGKQLLLETTCKLLESLLSSVCNTLRSLISRQQRCAKLS
ncbi:MAG: hypothetical protein ACLRVS_08350, partial [Lachnospiraceae bacterium]